MPEFFVSADPLSPEQLDRFQAAWDAVMEGDWRHKVRLLPTATVAVRCRYCRSVASGPACVTCGAPTDLTCGPRVRSVGAILDRA